MNDEPVEYLPRLDGVDREIYVKVIGDAIFARTMRENRAERERLRHARNREVLWLSVILLVTLVAIGYFVYAGLTWR